MGGHMHVNVSAIDKERARVMMGIMRYTRMRGGGVVLVCQTQGSGHKHEVTARRLTARGYSSDAHSHTCQSAPAVLVPFLSRCL